MRIPVSAEEVDSDEYDWCLVAKYRLPEEEVQRFTEAASLVSLAKVGGIDSKITSVMAGLDPIFSSVREKEGVVACHGRTDTNAWTFVFDPPTALLWVAVEFPDMAGDRP